MLAGCRLLRGRYRLLAVGQHSLSIAAGTVGWKACRAPVMLAGLVAVLPGAAGGERNA